MVLEKSIEMSDANNCLFTFQVHTEVYISKIF